ncbi:MAG: 3-keto-disaccharide hydrolase [Limisphaerales bacterium]
MKIPPILSTSAFLLAFSPSLLAASTGSPFYGDPPDDRHPWAIHDRNRPQPKIVAPGTFSSVEQPGKPPSDAIVLFDGTSFDQWESTDKGKPARWALKDGAMEATRTGDIRTKAEFGDCQLHVEWMPPQEIDGEGQGRGNSGIFLMGRVEIQVLDNYNNPTYADGQAGSVYGVNPPLVNALRPPGQFQVYDIVFRRPVYRGNEVLDPGYVTVFMNGVLVQDHTVLEGGTGHMGRTKPGPFPEKGPLSLQDHNNPTRFRNIWYRPLPPRAIEGGTDGPLTPEATMAKRREIAATLRQEAGSLKKASNPLPEMLRLMESLSYEKDAATVQTVETMAGQYVAGLKQLPADQLTGKKDEARHVRDAFKYLARWKILPASFGPFEGLQQIIQAQGWDKKPN